MVVDRPRSEVVAAGHRDTGLPAPGKERAEHDDRGPHLLYELVRRFGDELRRGVDHELARRVLTPMDNRRRSRARTSDMIETSVMSGTPDRTWRPSQSRQAAISFKTRVLRAACPDGSLQRAVRAHDKAVGFDNFSFHASVYASFSPAAKYDRGSSQGSGGTTWVKEQRSRCIARTLPPGNS